MKFSVNLASENIRAIKQCRVLLMLLAAGLLFLLLSGYQAGLAAKDQLATETARVSDLTQGRQAVAARLEKEGLVLDEAGRAAFEAEQAVARRMATQRLFLWSQLLADLEQVVPWGVSLVSLQPSEVHPAKGTATLTLKGEALTLKRLTGFVIKMEEADMFNEVVLVDQKGQRDGTELFTLHVDYRRQ